MKRYALRLSLLSVIAALGLASCTVEPGPGSVTTPITAPQPASTADGSSTGTSEAERFRVSPLFDTETIAITYLVDGKEVEQPEEGFTAGTDLYFRLTFSSIYDLDSDYRVLVGDEEVQPVTQSGQVLYHYRVTRAVTISIEGLAKRKASVTYSVPSEVTLTLKDGSPAPTTVDFGSTLEFQMAVKSEQRYGFFVNSNRLYADADGIYTIREVKSNLRIEVKALEDGPTIDKDSTVEAVYSFLSDLTESGGRYRVSFTEGYTIHHPSYLYQEYKNEGYLSLPRADKTDGSKALYHFRFDENEKIQVGGLAIENDQQDPSQYEIISDTSHYDPSLDLKVDGRLSQDKFTKKLTYGVVSTDSYILDFFTDLSEAGGSNYAMVVISATGNELIYKLYRYADNGYETDDYSWGKISEVGTAQDSRLDAYLASNPTLGVSLKNEQVGNLLTDDVTIHSELAIVNIDSTGNEVRSKGVSTDVIINKDIFRVIEDFPDYDDQVTRTFQNIDGKSNLVGIGGDNKPYYRASDGSWDQYLFPKEIDYSAFRQDSQDQNLYHYYGEAANQFIFTMSRVGFTNGLSIDDLTLRIENDRAKEMVVSYQKEENEGTTSYYEITLTFKEPEKITFPAFSKESDDADIQKVLSHFKDQTFLAEYANENEGVYREYRKTDEAIYIKDLNSDGSSAQEFGYYSTAGQLIPFAYDSRDEKYVTSGASIERSLDDQACSLASEIFTREGQTLVIKKGVTAISEFFLTKFLPSGIIDDTLKIEFDSGYQPTAIGFRLHGANGDYDCRISLSGFGSTELTAAELQGLSALKEADIEVTTWDQGYPEGYKKLVALYGEEGAKSIPFVKPNGNVTWKSSGANPLYIWFTEANQAPYASYLGQYASALTQAGFTQEAEGVYTSGNIKITIPSNPIMGLKFETVTK